MENKFFRALVVDDNEVNALILACMLDELLDISTDCINNGMDAVYMSARKKYSIIFIDHMMPNMDGVQTTTAIRYLTADEATTVIIALTADVTENIRRRYKKAGANDVLMKPLERTDLLSILQRWFPYLKTEEITASQTGIDLQEKNEWFHQLIIMNDEIDFATGLRNALGNPDQYIHILEISLQDLQICYEIILKGQIKKSLKEIQMGVHKLKNVCYGIGAGVLIENTILFEQIVATGSKAEIEQECELLIGKLSSLKEKLQVTLQSYRDNESKTGKKENQTVMSKEEYEHCLLTTIYYIRRYDYYAIIKGMECLVSCGRVELIQEFEKVLIEIREYKYEQALERMLKIKNKTVDETVSE